MSQHNFRDEARDNESAQFDASTMSQHNFRDVTMIQHNFRVRLRFDLGSTFGQDVDST